MKRLITSAVLLLCLLTSQVVFAESVKIATQGDTTLIINGSDTLTLTGLEGIGNKIMAVLNDTLVNLDQNDQASNVESIAIKEASLWSRTAESIVSTISVAVVFIVFFCLLFYFLHRRRKYRMVEKAIANNYQLPPYVFGHNHPTYAMPPIPTPNVAAEQIVENGENGETPVGDPILEQQTPPPFIPVGAPTRVNWRAFTSSFTLVAVGIGLMIFFHDSAFLGIFSILVLLGLGRGFIEYQDQRDAIDAWRKR